MTDAAALPITAVDLQSSISLMTQHQAAFTNLITSLVTSVATIEDRVDHWQADMTVRVDDLERNMKNLAFNIQGFAMSKEEEDDMEAHRQLRVSKKKLLMKSRSMAGLGSFSGSFDSGSEESAPAETPKKTPKKAPNQVPPKKVVVAVEEEHQEEKKEEPVMAKVPPPQEEEKKEDAPAPVPAPAPASTPAPAPVPEPVSVKLEYVSTPETKARAKKHWKWAFRQIKARLIAKKISVVTARVNPAQSIGNRMSGVEEAVSHLQFELNSLREKLDGERNSDMDKFREDIAKLREGLQLIEGVNATNEKKVKATLGSLASLKEDFNASSRELGDLKNEVEEKVESALAKNSKKAALKAKKDKQSGLIKIMVEDLEGLQADVEETINCGNSSADPALLEELRRDILAALDQVQNDPQSEESLKTVAKLSTNLQIVLTQDDIKVREGELSLAEDDIATPESGVHGQAIGRDRSKSLHMIKTKSTRLSIREDEEDEDVEATNEDNLRSRMEGTGKRLADLMSAFSNVGKLELAVRQLQDQMKSNAALQKQINTEVVTVKTEVAVKADKVETDGYLAQKADLNMVQGLLTDLQAKQKELYHRTDPANLALELRNHNVGNDAVDSLSAHLSQTVENFEKIKREMNSKAGSADVAAAIQGMQQKFRGFVGETFSKDELASVLSSKVDKRELKKIASALAGMDGPASLTAGVVKCLICERPGFVQQQKALADKMGHNKVDPIDGRVKTPGEYELPDVKPPSRGDDIDRYKGEELVAGTVVQGRPRIMPPASRMRVSAGGGVRVSSGGR